MPPRNSATRGGRFPARGASDTALVTRPPRRSRSMTPSSSRPKPAVPAARRIGFWNRRPKTVRERSEAATLTARGGAATRATLSPAAGRGSRCAGARRDRARRRGAGPARLPAPGPARDGLGGGERLERVLEHLVARRILAAGDGQIGAVGVQAVQPGAGGRRCRTGRAAPPRAAPWARMATPATRPPDGGRGRRRGPARRAYRAPPRRPGRGGGRPVARLRAAESCSTRRRDQGALQRGGLTGGAARPARQRGQRVAARRELVERARGAQRGAEQAQPGALARCPCGPGIRAAWTSRALRCRACRPGPAAARRRTAAGP